MIMKTKTLIFIYLAFVSVSLASSLSQAVPVEGDPAPDFKLRDSIGADFSLSSLCGEHAKEKKVIVLDFWATWCFPCRRTMPLVDALYAKYRAKGVEVLFINFKESESVVRKFLASISLSSRVLVDPDGTVGKKFGIGGLMGLPRTMVLGRDCKVKRIFFGERKDLIESLEKEIEKALAAK